MQKLYTGGALIVALTSALVLPSGAKAETFTLAEALSTAYETNPQLNAQRASLRATDEEVAKALAGWRPSVAAQGSYGYEQGQYHTIPGQSSGTYPKSATVTITQPLFAGDTIANVRKAKALVEAGRGQLLATEETVLLNAVTAYMDVVRYLQTVKLQQDAVDDLQRVRDTIQRRVELGELSQTNLAQTDGRLNGQIAQLAITQGQLEGARATFEQVIGRPAESLDENSVLPVLPENFDAAISLALRNNPTLQYSRAQAVASDYAVNAAVGALLPSLSLQGQYERSSDQIAAGIKTDALSVTARLTVPLFQGGAEYAGVREAKQQRSQAGYTSADTERQVREQVRAANETLHSSQAAVRASQTQVDASRLAFVGIRQETITGERSTLDVLIAEQDLVNAQIALASSRRNAYVAAYQLLSGTGGLTAKGLSLPVKLYEPQEHYDRDAARWIGLGE